MAKEKSSKSKMTLEDLKNKMAIRPPEYVRTGVLPIDLVFKGKGLPTNCYVVLWSESGWGKSTTQLSIAKSLSAQSKKTMYAMIEDSMQTAEDMGVVGDPNVLFLNVRSYVEAEQVFDQFLESDYELLILDSITALCTTEVIQLDEETGEQLPASDARLSAALEKKFSAMLKNTGKMMLIIAQERANFNKGWTGPATTMAGGFGLKFYAGCVVMGCGVRKIMDPETKQIVGTTGYLTVPEKNRFASPGGRSPVQILFGKGQSNIYAVMCYMQWKGYYEQRGSSFALHFKDYTDSLKGRVGLLAWIKDHYKELAEDFYANAEAYFEAGKAGWRPSE